jgi:hypothetical protein
VLVLLAFAVAALGYVLGFNQLATQSPVDAVLPVALLCVGGAGVVVAAASLVAIRDRPAVALGDAPPLGEGFAALAVGLAGLASVTWRWGVAAQAATVGVAGVLLALEGVRGLVLLARRHAGAPDPYRTWLVATPGGLLVAFAVAALADGGVRPFA